MLCYVHPMYTSHTLKRLHSILVDLSLIASIHCSLFFYSKYIKLFTSVDTNKLFTT